MKIVWVLLLGALGVGATPAAGEPCTGCSSPSFSQAIRAYPAGGATDLAVADFDNDGVPDVVVTSDTQIGFFRGTGSGSLAAETLRDSAGSNSITTADFNGDGNADVATAGVNLSIFLGNGNGTFQDPIEYTPDFQAFTFIDTADFNGDGIPDLVVTAFNPSWVRVYIGHGDGTFADPLQLTGPFPTGLAVGDFDGDGRTDIAVDEFAGGIWTFLNDGHGGFGEPRVTDPTGIGFGRLVSGDFDRDGVSDLAVAKFDGIVFLLGTGTGTFVMTQVVASFTGGPSHGIVEDFNGDGIPDFAFSVDQEGTVSRLPGLGDGTFGPEVKTPAGDQLGPLASADLNGDGVPDLAVYSYSYVEVLLSAPDGSIALPAVYDAGESSGVAAAGNFMGNGRSDLVTTGTSASIVPNLGFGVFGEPIPLTLAAFPIQVAAGDFAAGGGTDVAISTQAGIQIVVSNGDGTFQVLAPFGSSAAWLVAADFNHDGKPDLAWIDADLHVALGNGDGTFAAPTDYAGLGGYALTAGDFDGDTIPDIAVVFPDHFTVMLNDGDGAFTQGVSYSDWFSDLTRITSADFDGDGKTDVAVALYGGFQVLLYWGAGDGTFAAAPPAASNLYVLDLFPGDVNGDGRPELVLNGVQSTRILTIHADRSFDAYEMVQPTIASGAILADTDGDGKNDVVFVGGAGPTVRTFRSTVCEPARIALATQPASCAAGAPFATQPVIHVLDDGDNLVTCEDLVTAAYLVPGTGTPGAVLGGTVSIPDVAGVAAFTDLSIDLPGRGYRVAFSRAPLTTIGRSMTLGLTAGIVGPSEVCATSPASYRTSGSGYDLVQWTLDGAPVSRAELVTLAGLAEGPHTVGLTVHQDACSAAASTQIEVAATPAPVIVAPDTAGAGATGLVASVVYHSGSTYNWTVTGGTLTGGQGSQQITFDAGAPGTTMEIAAVEQSFELCVSPEATATVQVDFADVPPSNPFHAAVAIAARLGITAGCGGGQFCYSAPMTRAQAAVLLLKAKHGSSFAPRPASGVFFDVPPGSFAADWIEDLVAEGIAAGCGGGNFCPAAPVTRAQVAVWLLKAEHGAAFAPPACEGIFGDVACAPPAFAVDWIEALYGEGVTGGCQANPLLYCPDLTVTRGQAAAFLVRTFNLQ